MILRHRFPRRLRLTQRRQFDAVYEAKVRASAGPLVVWAIPNALEHPRLGLSVARGVGRAVARNRIRRLIRESFRLLQHDIPSASPSAGSYDLVVSVRRHEPMSRDEYVAALQRAVQSLQRAWSRKSQAGDEE